MDQKIIIFFIISFTILTIVLILHFKGRKKKKKRGKGRGINVKKYERAHHLSATVYYVLMILFFLGTILFLSSFYSKLEDLLGVLP